MKAICITLLSATLTLAGVTGEIADWGEIISLGVSSYILYKSGPFTDKPLIGGDTDALPKNETISTTTLYSVTSALSFGAIFAGNEGDYYRKIKGYSGMLSSSRFATNLLKCAVGSPRPDADAKRDSGTDERRVRDSFPSGHASLAFGTATHLSIWLWEDYEDDVQAILTVKSAITAALFGGAIWVGHTRVEDNVHRERDVLAGAIVGCASSFASYYIWEQKVSDFPTIIIHHDGISANWRF